MALFEFLAAATRTTVIATDVFQGIDPGRHGHMIMIVIMAAIGTMNMCVLLFMVVIAVGTMDMCGSRGHRTKLQSR